MKYRETGEIKENEKDEKVGEEKMRDRGDIVRG